MKIKILLILVAVLSVAMLVMSWGCGGDSKPSENDNNQNKDEQTEVQKQDITGVTFDNLTVDYDGNEHEIKVSGSIPEDVTVNYTDNKFTDAGTYNAKAVLSGEKYNTKTLNAVLTIKKIDITGVTFEDSEIKHDGNDHALEVKGTLPKGVTVAYTNNVGNAVGKYEATAVLSGKNYNELKLNAVLTIKMNYGELALTVINSFGSTPDIWSFLPESFSRDTRLLTKTAPVYTDFSNVTDIPLNGMGKQLNMVYGVMDKASEALVYVNQVYKVANTIKNLYSTFLDGDPENYKHFEGNAGAFGFSIDLTETQYLLKANVKKVNLTIFSDVQNKTYGAKVQLTDTTILKYTVSEGELLIAMDILDTSATQIQFVRENNNVCGYIYEFLKMGDKQLMASSAMLTVNNEYTSLIGTKGDFAPTTDGRNCEVYRNSDGQLVGTEVRETQEKLGTFNTLWYPLCNLQKVNSIKKIDEQNGSNPDTIFINNGTNPIHSKLVGGISKDAFSRRFDIEFKTMYFYTFNAEKEKYESVKAEIPMIFIQEKSIETFESDFSKENKEYLSNETVTLVVSLSVKNEVKDTYYNKLIVYDKIKDSVTHEMITSYCKK